MRMAGVLFRHRGILGYGHRPGFEGAIVVRGQRLEERPLALTLQARAEDVARAKTVLRNETDALRLTQSQLPGANAGRAKDRSLVSVWRSIKASTFHPIANTTIFRRNNGHAYYDWLTGLR